MLALGILPFPGIASVVPSEVDGDALAKSHVCAMDPLETWVERARDGDMAAFRLLYERTRPGLHNMVVRLVDDEDEAHEIVQLSFVKAWQKLHELRDHAAFSGWLRRVATNVLRDHWRRTNRFEELPGDDAIGALQDDSPGAADILVERERMDHLSDAVAQLPPMFRLPVVLHYLDDRSVEEVAGILDVPRGTVLSRLSRARVRLRDALLRRKDGKS